MSARTTDARQRIIVALDVSSAAEARSIADELTGAVGAFKIGLQLFTAAGPDLVRDLVGSGHRIFLDLKFHDIPNTAARASIEAARMGVWMFNLHAAGGAEMMIRSVEAVGDLCDRSGAARPLMIAVTVLTSSDAATLAEIGVASELEGQVLRLSSLAAEAGLDGVVASPRESRIIRESASSKALLIVTPGIRPNHATVDDQKRVTTFGQAMSDGSDYVVIGRPVTQAQDRLAAVERLCEEIRPK